MFFLYQIIVSALLLISPVIIIYRILKNKEDSKRFIEKFSISSEKRRRGKLIWFHGASVGEILSIIPIIKNYENIYIFQKTLNPVYNYQFDLIYTIEDKNYVKVKNPNDRCVDIIDYCTYYNTEVNYKRILGYSFFYNSKK